MKNSMLPYWLALSVVLAALYGGFKLYQVESYRSANSMPRINLPPLTSFELTDHNGKPFRSADMKGKVWVVSFFYSTCPFTCSRLNANIKTLTALDELKGVSWVSITVDPETDTQAVLSAYAKQLNANEQRWRFCRHEDFEYIKRLSDDVLRVGGVSYKGHNDYVVVIDRNGEIAGMFNGYDPVSLKRGMEVLRKLLANDPESPQGAAEAA